MATVSLINLVNNTTADANQVMQNFNSLGDALNANLDDTNMKANSLSKAIAKEGVAPNQTINIPSATDVFGTDNKGFIYGSASFQVTKDGTSANKINVTSGTAWVVYNNALRNVTVSPTSFTTSNTSTTYYLDLNPDQTWSFSGLHSSQANYLPVAVITTDSSANVSTITDVRSLYTRLGSNLRAQSLDGLAVTDVLQSRVSPNLVANAGFEAVSGTATVFSDALTSYTGSSAAPWTIRGGSFAFGASGATCGANGSYMTAGNAQWKPVKSSDGSTHLALTAQTTVKTPATLSTGDNGQVILYDPTSGYNYVANLAGSSSFVLGKNTGSGYTQLASVSQTIVVSTTYIISLSLDDQGNLTATLKNSGGTVLQTLKPAADTSVNPSLIGVGGDTGVIISNASVTAPFADGWTVDANGSSSGPSVALSSSSLSGKYALSFNWQGNSGRALQTVSGLTANTNYTLSFYAQVLSGSGVQIDVPAISKSATVSTVGNWVRSSVTLNSGSNTSLEIDIRPIGGLNTNTTSNVLIDDIQLEPGSTATPYIPQIQHPATPVDLDPASTVGLANIVRALSGGYKVQSGASVGNVTTAGTAVNVSVTFPSAFSNTPTVFAVPGVLTNATNTYTNVLATSPSTTGFTVTVNSGVAQNVNFQWLAIGQ